MYVHLKQSGELLASQGDPSDLWTPAGIVASADKITSAFRSRDRTNMEGLLLVSGAGNIIRGDKLRKDKIANGYADLMGRLATIQNTLALAGALREKKLKVAIFIANSMALKDVSIDDGDFAPYDIEAVREAYANDRVVMVAGGTGEDNKTTDNAVLEYARRHSIHSPDEEIVVLKGTKHDGVFDTDPAKNAHARRYARITAGYMLADYPNFSVVDRSCLETIQDSGLTLRVYQDGRHDLLTASNMIDADAAGTLIVPGDASEEPIFPYET